jgi:hypothetical protein
MRAMVALIRFLTTQRNSSSTLYIRFWMKKIKCDASLEEEISFGLAFLHRKQRLAKGTAQYKHAIDW